MRILFVYPNRALQNPPPVSVALLSAIARAEGAETALFDQSLYAGTGSYDQTQAERLKVRPWAESGPPPELRSSDPAADLRAQVTAFAPDLILLTCNEATWTAGRELLRALRDYPGRVVVGGVFPTFAPDLVLRENRVDAVCAGEGEQPVAALVRGFLAGTGFAAVPNLQWRRGGKIITNPAAPPVDLNTGPLPDFGIFAPERLYRPMGGRMWRLLPLETSRGCPYRCTFCNSPAQEDFYRSAGGRFFRKKSIARLDAEIRDLVARWQPEYLFFLSDILMCYSPGEFDDFCRMYEKYRLPFYCQNRPEMIEAGRVKRLRDIGCHRMTIGIQHGNEAFRRRLLGPTVPNSAIIEAVATVMAAGIPVSVDVIIGFPDETRELVFDSVRLVRQMRYDTISAFAFMPFHGTALHRECVARGFIEADAVTGDFTQGTCLRMPQFPPAEIDGLVRTFALYALLPESDWPDVRAAEPDTPAARAQFARLRERCRFP